jgi:glycosyltransferase involved in cell wall biosynthesis
MNKKLVVFDSHPVQYRVPVWQAIEAKMPDSLHVVYASDCSVRGHADSGFGIVVAWDEPMLDGYAHTILNCENGAPLSGWSSLTGKGVQELLDKLKPDIVLLTGLNYRYDWVVYRQARKRKIPVWLRCETQDEANIRPKWKTIFRSLLYSLSYKGLAKFFYIGELNRQHYIRHGVPSSKLLSAPYSTSDRFATMEDHTKSELRALARSFANIGDTAIVIGFSGKLIPKKNPGILFEMLRMLPEKLRKQTHLYFLGSGELEEELKQRAATALKEYGVHSVFAGFVNQTELPRHYLAMDIMVLPSRRMGETWGLVANEAMQAGCSVIVSDAVGCNADFKSWERFRVFKEGDVEALANNITDLARFVRNFDWARKGLENYSINNVAHAIVKAI